MKGEGKENIKAKEDIEINFWRDSPTENPESFSRSNFLNKTRECLQLDYKLSKYRRYLKDKKNILEIGAGQGWASCYMKKYFVPDAQYTVTDISPFAIESLHYWEAVFDVKMLNSLACKSYEVPLRDESYDLIFCYAAAHHFVKIKESLAEFKRLLKPGGCILFLYEPTCSKWFYPLHFRYVNSVNHGTPEDILIPAEIKKIARSLDLTYTHFYDAQQRIIRSIKVAMYFRILKAFPFLQRVLPSSSDMVFGK